MKEESGYNVLEVLKWYQDLSPNTKATIKNEYNSLRPGWTEFLSEKKKEVENMNTLEQYPK